MLSGHTVCLIRNLDFTHLAFSYCAVQGIFLVAWLNMIACADLIVSNVLL